MRNKKLMLALALAVAILLGNTVFLEKYVYPKHPEWRPTEIAKEKPPEKPVAIPTTAPTTSPTTLASAATQQSPGMSAMPLEVPATKPSGQFHIAASTTKPAGVSIGSKEYKDPNYALALNLTPNGAAIDSVVLNGYNAVDDKTQKLRYTFQHAYKDHDETRSLATMDITITPMVVDDKHQPSVVDVSHTVWILESSSADKATYAIDLEDGAGNVLHITKAYSIEPKKSPGGGYEATLVYHVKNLSQNKWNVRFNFNGPTVPPQELDSGIDRQFLSATDKGTNKVNVNRHVIEELKKGHETEDLKKKDDKGFLWAGTCSAYFDAIVLPDKLDDKDHPESIESAVATALNPDSEANDRLVAMKFTTVELPIDPAGQKDMSFHLFFGPKERDLLENDYYSAFPRHYGDTLVAPTTFLTIPCAFPILIDALVGILKFFHDYITFKDWGLAIILLVVIVRVCLHPITKASQVSMLKMQKMGPELERLKKKHGDDKEAFAKAQMQLYKEIGITPVLGCAPMLLQMPIWMALYSALRGEFALRQAPFLWGWTWIHDLARPDGLLHFGPLTFTLPLIGHVSFGALNLLPLLLAVVFFLQQKFTPKPPATTPEQKQQQKMMQWMSLLFPVFLYNQASGLNLYICTSTTIGIIESKRIRDHIKQKQEAEKAGKVIVDAGPTRASKQNKKDELKTKAMKQAEKAGKAGGLRGWWAELQKKAEDMRREAERGKKKL